MGYWFRQKSYGYGATPANWQGWVATLVFLVVVLGLIWFMVVANALAGMLTGLDIVVFIVAVLIVSLAFV